VSKPSSSARRTASQANVKVPSSRPPSVGSRDLIAATARSMRGSGRMVCGGGV